MSDLYQQVLLEELDSPQNKGVMEHPDVLFHAVNASCGDDMTVYLAFEGQTVKDISWVGFGCAISQATMSLLSEEIKGKTRDEIGKISKHDLEKLIGIKEISTGRIKCLMLGLSAVNQAILQKNM
jgi:nitrogen fixation NifU-like protein